MSHGEADLTGDFYRDIFWIVDSNSVTGILLLNRVLNS